jgi:hypothetical protein
MDTNKAVPALQVAEQWEAWCGDTPWSRAMREWANLGGKVISWGGRPQSASAIPLCFVLIDAADREMPGSSRLKDIRAAIEAAK